MKYTKTNFSGTTEILANDHYAAIPMTLTASLKAGAPVASTGAVGTDQDTIGILLWDVDVTGNPNGTVVIHGFVETAKAQANSGVTITNAMKALIPMVHFN